MLPGIQILLTHPSGAPEAAQAIIDFATQNGFTAQVLDPAANVVNLSQHLQENLPERAQRKRRNRGLAACFTRYDGLCLYDMARLTLVDFVRGWTHDPDAGCLCIYLESEILRLMIERGIRFQDQNPAEVFTCLLADATLETRAYNILEDLGCRWIEQSAYFTKREFGGVRNVGARVMSDLESALGAPLRDKW